MGAGTGNPNASFASTASAGVGSVGEEDSHGSDQEVVPMRVLSGRIVRNGTRTREVVSAVSQLFQEGCLCCSANVL